MSHIIGIDVSKATLDCAWLRDSDQDKARRKSCQNAECCFEPLLTWQGDDPLSREALQAQLASPEDRLTFTCTAWGSGVRIGIDRDLDGILDGDETSRL